jgi:hypothetical protein
MGFSDSQSVKDAGDFSVASVALCALHAHSVVSLEAR